MKKNLNLPTMEESLDKLIPELESLLGQARYYRQLCSAGRKSEITVEDQRSFNKRIYDLKNL